MIVQWTIAPELLDVTSIVFDVTNFRYVEIAVEFVTPFSSIIDLAVLTVLIGTDTARFGVGQFVEPVCTDLMIDGSPF